MYIEIDLSVVPPAAVLHEPEDFTEFKMTVRPAEHAWIGVEPLEQLAGDRATDPEWRQGLATMLEYAQEHGWADGGAVRAHIEWPG